MKIIDSNNAFKINLEAGKASLEGKEEFKVYRNALAKVFLAVAEFFGFAVKVSNPEGVTQFYAFKGAFQKALGLKDGFTGEDVKALIDGVKKEVAPEVVVPVKTPAERADEAGKAADAAQKALDDAVAAKANDADIAKLTAELDAAKKIKEDADKVVADEKAAAEKAAADKAPEEKAAADKAPEEKPAVEKAAAEKTPEEVAAAAVANIAAVVEDLVEEVAKHVDAAKAEAANAEKKDAPAPAPADAPKAEAPQENEKVA